MCWYAAKTIITGSPCYSVVIGITNLNCLLLLCGMNRNYLSLTLSYPSFLQSVHHRLHRNIASDVLYSNSEIPCNDFGGVAVDFWTMSELVFPLLGHELWLSKVYFLSLGIHVSGRKSFLSFLAAKDWTLSTYHSPIHKTYTVTLWHGAGYCLSAGRMCPCVLLPHIRRNREKICEIT